MKKIKSVTLVILMLLAISPLFMQTSQANTRTVLSWVEATPSANWSGRWDSASVVFDNKMWMLGGYDVSPLNEVWYSSDGVNWTEATASANWSARYGLSAVVFDNKMWIMGGYDNSNYYNDVWYSTDGINWVEANSSAGWAVRIFFGAVVFDNKIFVFGGVGSTLYGDVWYSPDGINWTEATASAGWTAREAFGYCVFDNKTWVIGGYDGSNAYDVWYTPDGTNWTAIGMSVLPMGWTDMPVVTFENQMWILGGYTDLGKTSDVLHSSDGVNWTEANPSPWQPRYAHVALVYNNHIWVIGGYPDASGLNDVWYSNFIVYHSRGTITLIGEQYAGDFATFGMAGSTRSFFFSNSTGGYIISVCGNNVSGTMTNQVIRTDVDTNVSVVLGTIPIATIQPGICFDQRNMTIYILGGYNDTYGYLDVIQKFNLINNTGSLTNDTMPVGAYKWCINGIWYNGSAYVFGGFDGVNSLGAVIKYTPSIHDCSLIHVLGRAIRTPGAIYKGLGDVAYLFGGADDVGYVDEVRAYCFTNNSDWVQAHLIRIPTPATCGLGYDPINDTYIVSPTNSFIASSGCTDISMIGPGNSWVEEYINTTPLPQYDGRPDLRFSFGGFDNRPTKMCYYFWFGNSGFDLNIYKLDMDLIHMHPWDINNDNAVNYLDVSLLVSHYGQSGSPGFIPEDINLDGFVNYLDVSALVSHYGEIY